MQPRGEVEQVLWRNNLATNQTIFAVMTIRPEAKKHSVMNLQVSRLLIAIIPAAEV